ncbi:MAG: M28 family metallopeptidase [Solirubrobacterales bacterium]
MRSPPSPRFAPALDAPSARARARRRIGARLSAALLSVAVAALAGFGCGSDGSSPDRFDSARAFDLIERQVAFGPRPAGSEASQALGRQLRRELPNFEVQPLAGGLLNLISVIPGEQPAIVIGAHYDTEATIPDFVGANDGAAGTAAVVELAKILPGLLPDEHREIRLVLFDGEEEPAGCPERRFQECALRGSKAYVAAHPGETGEMILLDYIANKGLQIPREQNSDQALWARLREAASELGAESYFPDAEQPPIIDDHVPFLEAGVPSIDLIDFTYLYADTAQDTVDKLDPAAFDAVGETVAELVIALSELDQ